jgi:N-acetylated-alpha-linked acidic dipeptidase
MIYAPGLYTGYGVKTLPAIREAIEQREWETIEQYVPIVAASLNAYSDRLNEAVATVKK